MAPYPNFSQNGRNYQWLVPSYAILIYVFYSFNQWNFCYPWKIVIYLVCASLTFFPVCLFLLFLEIF